jgi:hypothetical protein
VLFRAALKRASVWESTVVILIPEIGVTSGCQSIVILTVKIIQNVKNEIGILI